MFVKSSTTNNWRNTFQVLKNNGHAVWSIIFIIFFLNLFKLNQTKQTNISNVIKPLIQYNLKFFCERCPSNVDVDITDGRILRLT